MDILIIFWFNKKYTINILYCLILFNTNQYFNIHIQIKMNIDLYQNISISVPNSVYLLFIFLFYLSIANTLFNRLVWRCKCSEQNIKHMKLNVSLFIQRMNMFYASHLFSHFQNFYSLRYLVGCEQSEPASRRD